MGRSNDSRMGGSLVQNRLTQVTGSVISAVRDACRNALLDWSPRLKLAMYSCDIQASSKLSTPGLMLSFIHRCLISADVLGKVYGVVAKRRGRIIGEEMKEGTSYFTVSALLPVVESFGFADGTQFFGLDTWSLNRDPRYKKTNIGRSKPPIDFQRVSGLAVIRVGSALNKKGQL